MVHSVTIISASDVWFHVIFSIIRLSLVALLCLHQCDDVAGNVQVDYYNLMDYLFNDYKPEVRPTESGNATVVYLSFSLQSIVDLDEQNQVLETSVYIILEWEDPWLYWNTSDYGGIEKFRYPQRKLWLPDVVVLNSVESQDQLGYNESPVRIESSGTIRWVPTEILHTACDIDVTYYPFDTQKCSIILTTWTSLSYEVDLDPYAGDVIDLSSYSKSGTWDLISADVSALPDFNDYTRIEFTFTIKRLRTYYVVNIILPVIFLSFTASMVFYLPADAGEKMGMSITVLLAFAVYLTIVADKMPQTSLQTSILSVYLSLLLAVTAKGVLMSVIVLNMHHRPADQTVGRRVSHITRKVRCTLRLDNEQEERSKSSNYKGVQVGPSPNSSPPLDTRMNTMVGQSGPPTTKTAQAQAFAKDNSDIEEPEEVQITWPIVAATVDRVCFVTYSVFIVVLTVIVMLLLLSSPDSESLKQEQ